MWRSVALRVRSRFARPPAPSTPQTGPDEHLQRVLTGVPYPRAVLRARVQRALRTPLHCPVCGDPAGVRCCQHGADREAVIADPWLTAREPTMTWDPRVPR